MRSRFPDVTDDRLITDMATELENSSRNQAQWLEISANVKPSDLSCRSWEWESTLVYGHPTHPYHRMFYPQSPLYPFDPRNLIDVIHPSLVFVAVPRTDLRISGAFKETLEPLLAGLGILSSAGKHELIVPCLAQQLPAVQRYFPQARVLKTVSECADAQASMRTLTLRPELDFPFHLKLSLACRITSAVRTISPLAAMAGPAITDLRAKLLPLDFWVFREVGAVAGNQADSAHARHLCCILRDDLEARAKANNEALIIAAALAQCPYPLGKKRSYAEILFNLRSHEEKRKWFRRYVACLFRAALPPLVHLGIGLEAHGQNIVVRSHAAALMSSLGLERHGGWAIVQEELGDMLNMSKPGRRLHDFFLGDTMPFMCFLRLRMEERGYDHVERQLPNVLFMDSPRLCKGPEPTGIQRWCWGHQFQVPNVLNCN
ncbi:IucA / IucC family protein [Hirsutella rhossiliensis]|uniref:IucA / iucC family domain-containing protein n=1 Tax=Hirsutella rhossiliensis TaxID=111463 RepID=A0A9P8N7Z3_9HYPO|nr:iucA / iucC family domain-containing protein [Hirsutella rhossiliensis]KAH0968640.1 iucA / iucC family domain-containing protein [Hirsutella rhossiliensis]